MDFAAAYEETHDQPVELVRGAPQDGLSTVVPASPAWDVRDVVAHVTGIATDVAAGTIPAELRIADSLWDPARAIIRDGMTAGQVDARRGRPLEEILAEWSSALESLLPMLGGDRPFRFAQAFVEPILVTDLAVHAQDVRGALGVPGDRASAGIGVALASYSVAVGTKIRLAGLHALRRRYDSKERILGDGGPAVTVEADRFELVRALSGRRSRDQIRAFVWEGDPDPYLPLIPAYGERLDPVDE